MASPQVAHPHLPAACPSAPMPLCCRMDRTVASATACSIRRPSRRSKEPSAGLQTAWARGTSKPLIHVATALPSSARALPCRPAVVPTSQFREGAAAIRCAATTANDRSSDAANASSSSNGNGSPVDLDARKVENEEEESRRELGSSISDFIRFYENAAGDRVELQTAVVTYTRPAPWWDLFRPAVQVDLVSVVHIGDEEYYNALQHDLTCYDRVLFEMVADKRAAASSSSSSSPSVATPQRRRPQADWRSFVSRAPPGRWMPPKRNPNRKRRGLVGSIQSLMSRVLSLSFQLDLIDYRRANFYHADLDYQTFCRLQSERGESMFSFAREVAVRSTKAILRTTAAATDTSSRTGLGPFRRSLLWLARFVPMPLVGLLLIEGVCAHPATSPLVRAPEFQALMNLDIASALKVVLAKQITMDTLDGAAGVMESSVIIGERNRACMDELQQAVAAGSRRVAIFYGSGHLPDLHRRLRAEMNMKATGVTWRSAWTIRRPPLPGKQGAAGGAAPAAVTGLGAAAAMAAAAAPATPSLPPLATRSSKDIATSTTSTISSSSSSSLLAMSARGTSALSSLLARLSLATGWPLNRYQTTALLLLSVVMALDLWLWEVVLGSVKEGGAVLLEGVGRLLDQGWGL